ncbi:hypothetical protein P7C70_g8650, partial [Phenoliferia sp. Uapishka_3]
MAERDQAADEAAVAINPPQEAEAAVNLDDDVEDLDGDLEEEEPSEDESEEEDGDDQEPEGVNTREGDVLSADERAIEAEVVDAMQGDQRS